ncbi:MAG TPA: hypothetical protein VKZ78_07755, partial [Sphingobacteriaceae bacterium]|nr:hypothetical protein [Sphingobacteriaceae bacterium]
MKNTKLIWSLGFMAATLITACNNEFLDKMPTDQVSNETFWNTENDLRVYNNGLYHLALNDNTVPIMMAHHNGFDGLGWSYYFLDGFADNLAPRNDRHAFFQQVRAGKQIVPSNPQWFGYSGWNFVRAINIGLANYQKAAVTEPVRNRYIGEARLFRG